MGKDNRKYVGDLMTRALLCSLFQSVALPACYFENLVNLAKVGGVGSSGLGDNTVLQLLYRIVVAACRF